MSVLEFVLICIAIYITVSAAFFAVKRTKLLVTVSRLGRYDGVSVQILHPMLFYLPCPSKKSAALLTVGGKRYSLRILNGKGSLYSLHMASERFAVIFVKSEGGVKVRFFGKRTVKTTTVASGVYFPRTVYIPEGECTDAIPLTVLCPAPREMTYVTPNKTSIAVAFTGDKVNGERIFTTSTLDSFIDRDSRGFFDN